MMNFKKHSYLILWGAFILAIGIVWLFGQTEPEPVPPIQSTATPIPGKQTPEHIPELFNRSSPSPDTPSASPTVENIDSNMVGLWVPFMSLSTVEKTEAAFKENFQNIADSAKEKGINALFVHVRPYSDALYPSSLFPWSHIVTGTQGTDPGYDPLAFMIDYTHQLGMEFHAWINPLRVKSPDSSFELSADNPYSKLKADNPSYFMEYDGGIYLNPAAPYIRHLIADGAAEIAQNYAVDGIHFDDYFYPTDDASLDSDIYTAYTSTVEEPIALSAWRTGNINAMIAEVYQKIKAAKSDVVFGISPTGNIGNNKSMNADVKTWCAIPGYIDYICPQIYYSYEHPTLGYSEALNEWSALPKHENLNIYIGLALYKAGTDADENTWLGGNMIARQIEDAEAIGTNGIILYSSDYLTIPETEEEVNNAVAAIQNIQ
ncbi:glycoside hydrolase family 10 protein [Scatolibacter rhodanostii]|uniref:glycoside hydrolase family 10 protein n=1 Tax=Scatolibacter rhodanostii TaxID=2014781 RepID=UPI000C07CA1F|nr:family 10 glycosylhydrolase [Scatolibacter rhodanostii]